MTEGSSLSEALDLAASEVARQEPRVDVKAVQLTTFVLQGSGLEWSIYGSH